jgi:hypothetical protein
MTPHGARMMTDGIRRFLVLLGSLAVLGFATAGVARADEPCPPTDISCLSTTVGDVSDDTSKAVSGETGPVSDHVNETMHQAEDQVSAVVRTAEDTVQTIEDNAHALVDDLLGTGGKDPGAGDGTLGGRDGEPGGNGTVDGGVAMSVRGHRAGGHAGSIQAPGPLPAPEPGVEVPGVLPETATGPTFGRTLSGLAFHLLLPLCLLAGLAVLFVAFQGQMDCRDLHLAGAPVVPDVVRFE